jgi:carboxymethylenebutenolidase
MNPKSLLIPLLLCFTLIPTAAQDWARKKVDNSPRHLEWVTLDADGRKVSTYVAYPEVAEKATAIVLIHEIYGHSDWFRLMADHLAEAGYVVVAPDLLSQMAPVGKGTSGFSDVTEVRKAVSELPPDQVTSDLKAAVEYAKNIPAANGKVVVAGFCWGGSQTFRFATNSDDIEAALVFYGTAPEADQLKRIQAPVYGFYAENDARVNATLEETAESMTKLGKDFVMEIYFGAGHGFMRAGEAPDASEGNKAARAKAWQRTMKLLKSLE